MGTTDVLRLEDNGIGGWLQLPGSATAELMGSVGFEFVCIDQQHGLIGDDALLPMLQALDATGTPTLVRVVANDAAAIGRADRGAGGVVVPLVDSADDARRAAVASPLPARGDHSYGPTRTGWRARSSEPLCVVMVETAAAVAALAEILAVDGVDAIFIGPSDLALNTGRPLEAQHGDAYDELVGSITAACRERGLPVGIYCATPARAPLPRPWLHVHRAVVGRGDPAGRGGRHQLSASRP